MRNVRLKFASRTLMPGRSGKWAVVVLGAAFIVAIGLRYDIGLVSLGLLGLATFGAAWLTRRVAGRSRVVGAIALALVVWLLPQRTDPGSGFVLAGCVGAGLALAFGPRPEAPRRWQHRAVVVLVVCASMFFAAYVGAETPSAHWFGGGITHGPATGGRVALTFDDGPNLTATVQVMRILDASHVKGTFFEVGHAIDKLPWITKLLYRDGQELGNHSYHHDQWRWLDPWYPELQRTQDRFQRTIDACPAFYRPPHGDRTPFVAHVVNDHHMRMVLWDDSAGDWAVRNPRTVARRILRGVHAGSIIVLHDGLNGNPTADRRVVVEALPLILAGLRARHLQPVRLDQLLGGPAYVPCQ